MVALACAWAGARAGSIDPSLAARLSRPAGLAQRPVAVIVELEDKPDLAVLAAGLASRPAAERAGALAASLRAAFDRSAPKVRLALERAGALRIEGLWLIHALAAQLPLQAVAQVAATPGVARVYTDMLLKAPVRGAHSSPRVPTKRRRDEAAAPPPAPAVASVDPAAWRGELPGHLSAIGVAAYWQRNITGRGAVVAIVDSGVDSRELPLMASFRGGRGDWFDPFGQHAKPYDASGHGTHVAYLITGGTGANGGPPIGVAPHARWIAARIYDDNGVGSISAVHRVYQWVLDPDGRAETTDAPQIVNNSWGLPQTVGRCHTEFARDFAALRAAGIHVVFAAGNEGPEPNTSMSPANNPGVLAVGALTAEGKVAERSGRGPSACGGGEYPQVYAPGVHVESVDAAARVLGEPLRVTGTSFAAALASGMLALIVSDSPAATVDERERRLARALSSSETAPAQKSPTALVWRPRLGESGHFEIDARSLLSVLPWTAKLLRLDIEDRPVRGKLETLSADRLRYVAEDAAPTPFTIVAHTGDGRSWRIAVQPQPALPAETVALRRVSFSTRPAEPLLIARSQLAGETAFDAVRASRALRGGRVEVGADGSVRYTPRAGFRGVDQFVCTLLAADGSARERVQVAVVVR